MAKQDKKKSKKNKKSDKDTGSICVNSHEVKKKKKSQKELDSIFETYKTWVSLPSIWKGLPAKSIENELGILEQADIEFLQIVNQKQFAEKYGVSERTLCLWNKKLDDENLDDPLAPIRKWATRLNKNVTGAHYKKLMKRFDPISAELWYKVISGWNEKKELEHSGKLSIFDLARQLDDEENKRNKQNKK